jgi:hypothetical protein
LVAITAGGTTGHQGQGGQGGIPPAPLPAAACPGLEWRAVRAVPANSSPSAGQRTWLDQR